VAPENVIWIFKVSPLARVASGRTLKIQITFAGSLFGPWRGTLGPEIMCSKHIFAWSPLFGTLFSGAPGRYVDFQSFPSGGAIRRRNFEKPNDVSWAHFHWHEFTGVGTKPKEIVRIHRNRRKFLRHGTNSKETTGIPLNLCHSHASVGIPTRRYECLSIGTILWN
jgi:hypothetical protein